MWRNGNSFLLSPLNLLLQECDHHQIHFTILHNFHANETWKDHTCYQDKCFDISPTLITARVQRKSRENHVIKRLHEVPDWLMNWFKIARFSFHLCSQISRRKAGRRKGPTSGISSKVSNVSSIELLQMHLTRESDFETFLPLLST